MLELPQLEEETRRKEVAHQLRTALIEKLLLQRLPNCSRHMYGTLLRSLTATGMLNRPQRTRRTQTRSMQRQARKWSVMTISTPYVRAQAAARKARLACSELLVFFKQPFHNICFAVQMVSTEMRKANDSKFFTDGLAANPVSMTAWNIRQC